MMNTFMANPDKIDRKWYVVDAEGCTLGRLASEVANVLRGKNKPIYTPHVDCGDYVIVVNADKIKVTGKKLDQKIYYRHSEYVGGMKETTLRELLAKKPERVIELAVKGMLPKGPLGRSLYTKLHVYAGAEHTHAAQKPEVMEIKG
jgi:ribosomal protein L13